jgi:hypothetical protein
MKRKWSLFAGAVILAGYVLISAGAPPLAILAGIALAAVYTGRRSHAV